MEVLVKLPGILDIYFSTELAGFADINTFPDTFVTTVFVAEHIGLILSLHMCEIFRTI